MKIERILLALAFAIVVASAQANDIGSAGDGGDQYQLITTVHVNPDYPRTARKRAQEGWVDVRFTIRPDGEIENIEVVDAQPKRVFERAALRAASQWQFAAPASEGFTTAQSGIIRMTFALN